MDKRNLTHDSVFLSRRKTMGAVGSGITMVLSGCLDDGEEADGPRHDGDTSGEEIDNGEDSDEDRQEEDSEEGSDDETEAQYDAVIEYSIHQQDGTNSDYILPEPPFKGWSWIVLDFEVIEGQLNMEDVWFQGLFETEQRYYTVSPLTDQVEDGIESRGMIREGNRGVTLHEFPPSPGSELIGPMYSSTRTKIGGEKVGSDGPSELYPPVSVEYSVQTAQNPDILPDDYAAGDGEEWAVVTLDVIDGVLNLEDVWFRSQLLTESRIRDCHQYSRFADHGVRSRGIVKEGFSANALYLISEGETVEEWGYEEGSRQDVTIDT